MTAPIRAERIHGALWGALVGDALGVPVEFLSREAVRRNPVAGMRGFGTHNQPAGTWSDDSSLLLCTVESLTTCQGLVPKDLGARFVRWKAEGHWTPHGTVFDIGIATSQAIGRLASGTAPERAGGEDEYSNGNGSLMRILPFALWGDASAPDQLASCVQRASALTHRHPRSQMACTLYCLLVRELLGGATPKNGLRTALNIFWQLSSEPPFAAQREHFELLEDGNLGHAPESAIASSGYVMDTLSASIWCLLSSSSFEETVLKAVNLGGDTDTTGTVAGGLAGACYGLGTIPPSWRGALARQADITALLSAFIASLPGSISIDPR